MLTKYDKQAEKFLNDTNTKIVKKMVAHGFYWDDDKETRDIYEIVISRPNKKPMIFKFGQSIARSGLLTKEYVLEKEDYRGRRSYIRKRQEPSDYDILACLTSYDPGSFENFCLDFGYSDDSIKANNTYLKVRKEWAEVQRIWTSEEIKMLREIY